MTAPAATTAELRARTRAHYDRYPFRFDQREVMSEKMEKRVVGAAIKELVRPGAVVLDVGCGACRVAHMVRGVGGRAVGVDLSFATIRSAREHNPRSGPERRQHALPLRNAVADLVISNGVIMVTPDARASFLELARVTKPGGTLVVSVYDKRSWYYPVYRYAAPRGGRSAA